MAVKCSNFALKFGFKFNNTKLPDDDNIEDLGGTNTNNVWNGQSVGVNTDGVDIDILYVR